MIRYLLVNGLIIGISNSFCINYFSPTLHKMFEFPLFQESNPNHERGPCDGENTENKCVVEWLRNLGLSKYEEIFTKEEVDWETLQWLTEEVVNVYWLVY